MFFFVVYCREENEVVPQVVQAVLSIPATAHIAVRYTTLQLLGELCEWMDSHPTVIGKCTEQWLSSQRYTKYSFYLFKLDHLLTLIKQLIYTNYFHTWFGVVTMASRNDSDNSVNILQ